MPLEGSTEYSISNFLNGIFAFTVTQAIKANTDSKTDRRRKREKEEQIENACTHTSTHIHVLEFDIHQR